MGIAKNIKADSPASEAHRLTSFLDSELGLRQFARDLHLYTFEAVVWKLSRGMFLAPCVVLSNIRPRSYTEFVRKGPNWPLAGSLRRTRRGHLRTLR